MAPVEIPLPCGRVAIIDADDFERVSAWRWRSKPPHGRGKVWYVYTWIRRKPVLLHRFIMNAQPGDPQIDHRNHDGMDNRKANLRFATQSQNNANMRTTNSTGYRGVCRVERGRFKATISHRQRGVKNLYLGRFATAEEAARAYDLAALARFGEFAQLSFPVSE